MEILPAVLLLLAFLLAGYRLLWLSHDLESATEGMTLRQSAFEAVWAQWIAHGGVVALAAIADDGGWKVHDFPDEAWLPSVEPSFGSLIWRRRLVEAIQGRSYWEIELKNADDGKWHWWARVLVLEANLQQEDE